MVGAERFPELSGGTADDAAAVGASEAQSVFPPPRRPFSRGFGFSQEVNRVTRAVGKKIRLADAGVCRRLSAFVGQMFGVFQRLSARLSAIISVCWRDCRPLSAIIGEIVGVRHRLSAGWPGFIGVCRRDCRLLPAFVGVISSPSNFRVIRSCRHRVHLRFFFLGGGVLFVLICFSFFFVKFRGFFHWNLELCRLFFFVRTVTLYFIIVSNDHHPIVVDSLKQVHQPGTCFMVQNF